MGELKKIVLVSICAFACTFVVDAAITYVAMLLQARISGIDPEELNAGNLMALGMLTALIFLGIFVFLFPWTYWWCWKYASRASKETSPP